MGKTPELTLALSSGGAILGKTLAGKGASLATTKALAGKLSAPFVGKVVAAGGGAVAGSVAGPVGTVEGATLGLGIDYSVNAGIELMKREEFIRDVEQVVEATRMDYYNVLELELHRAVRVWTEDAIQLLPSVANHKQEKKKKGREHQKHPSRIISHTYVMLPRLSLNVLGNFIKDLSITIGTLVTGGERLLNKILS